MEYGIQEMRNVISMLQAQMNFRNSKNVLKTQDETKSLMTCYDNLIKKIQTAAYITSNFLSGEEGIKIPYTAISEFNSKEVQQFTQWGICSYSQLIQQSLQSIVFSSRMDKFIKSIVIQFTEVTPDLILFAHVTFPSLFCFYTLPETFNFALSVLKTLVVINNPQVICHFISSFYESYPMFLTSLFEKLNELTFSLGREPTPMIAFHNLILSIQHACKFLTQEHFRLAQNCYTTNENLFSLTFIDTLLIPQLQIRNYDKTLIDTLTFVSNNRNIPSFHRLVKIFTNPTFTQPIILSKYGGFPYLNLALPKSSALLTWVPFYGTSYEILFTYEMLFSNDSNREQIKKTFKEFTRKKILYKIYDCRLYSQSLLKPNSVMMKRYERGFLFNIQEHFKIIPNQEFDRFFHTLIGNAAKQKINPLDFMDQIIASIKSKNSNTTSIIASEEFQIYALKKLANEYITKIRRYEILLCLTECIQFIEQILDMAKQNLSEMMPYVVNDIKDDKNNVTINGEIKFWKIIEDKNQILYDEIYDELVYYLVNDDNIYYLSEKEIIKLQTIMKSILSSNKRIVIITVPKIVTMLMNRFSYEKESNESNLILFNAFLSIISNCKYEFAMYFCYYFKYVDNGIDGSINVPKAIRLGWLGVFKLLGRFVFRKNRELSDKFSKFLRNDT